MIFLYVLVCLVPNCPNPDRVQLLPSYATEQACVVDALPRVAEFIRENDGLILMKMECGPKVEGT